MNARLELLASLLLRVGCIYVRHATYGVWPGLRRPVWVYPLRGRRVGEPRVRFATANPYCHRRAQHWVPRSWYAHLVAHFVWTVPAAPVVYIGRPPVREKAMAA